MLNALLRLLLVRILLVRLLWGLLDFFALVRDRHIRPEAFVVGVLDDFADVDVLVRARSEMQRVVGLGIGGEPILAIDLFAPGCELGKQVFVVLFADVWNR